MGYARTVTGVVTSASDKEPIIGASVQVQGTTRGAATDLDGKYTLEAQDNDVLVVTYVGMTPQKLKSAVATWLTLCCKRTHKFLKRWL